MAEAKASESREGLSLQTLVVAAVASGIAAVVVSHVWQDGTVLAAAMTPVVVSIVKELLQRPIQSEAVRRSASRVSSVAAAPARRVASTTGSVRTRSGTRVVEQPPHEPVRGSNGTNGNGSSPHGDVLHAGPRRTYGSDGGEVGRRRLRLTPRQWRIAIVTGVLAFVVAVAALTLPELIFGGAATSGHRTTIFGGGSSDSSSQNDKQKDQNGDSSSNDQQGNTQPNDSTSTQPGTSQPNRTQPPSSQTQTQPQQQQPSPQSKPPPDSGGGGSTQPAPQSPVPTPPTP